MKAEEDTWKGRKQAHIQQTAGERGCWRTRLRSEDDEEQKSTSEMKNTSGTNAPRKEMGQYNKARMRQKGQRHSGRVGVSV